MLKELIEKYNNKKKINNKDIFSSKTTGYLLTFVAGIMGVYSFKISGGVFGNGLTGDILNIGISIVDKKFLTAIKYIAVILFFSLGVIISYHLKNKFKKVDIHENGFRRICLVIEAVLLTASYFVKNEVATLFLITIALGIQIEIFDNMRGKGLSTVNYVGNTKNAAEYIVKYIEGEDKRGLMVAGYYYIAFIFFAFGGAVGDILFERIGERVALVCVLCFVIIFILSFLIIKNVEKKDGLKPTF